MRRLAPLFAAPLLLANTPGGQEAEPATAMIIVVPLAQFQPPPKPARASHEPLAERPNPPLPDHARAMLAAALAAGNEGEVNTVVKYLRQAEPDHAREISGIANEWRRERQEAATRRLQESDFWALVKGRAEIGGFMTTGNTNNTGVHGKVDLRREGYSWRHKWLLNAEYQESSGVTSRERYVASYEPNYKIDDRLFVFGNAMYEADRFAGYHARYSAAAGAGYTAIRDPGVTLNLSLGPAFRHVDFTEDPAESQFAARGSIDFDWRINPNVTLNQDTSAYLQLSNSTVTATTAVRAKLIGPLQGQVSHSLNYETMPPLGRKNTDTTSRASLVYQF